MNSTSTYLGEDSRSFSEGQGEVASEEHGSADGPQWIAGVASSARITKVGLWLTLVTLILSVAAANTGNNSLYLVISASASLLIVAWWLARRNVRGMQFKIEVPEEIYAGSPALLKYQVRRQAPGVAVDLLLLIEGSRSGTLLRQLRRAPVAGKGGARKGSDQARSVLPSFLSGLGANSSSPSASRMAKGHQDVLYLQRGLHRIGQAKALSLYPMGLFRRQVTFSSTQEVIVLPEIFQGVRRQRSTTPAGWNENADRIGRTEDLHSLRDFRSGDDPRSIHWKQSARNSRLIYQERSDEQSLRVSVLVDSWVSAEVAKEENRFERLVSEAATACVEYLDHGYEVELVLREGSIGFGTGNWHRTRLLEALALLHYRVERFPQGPSPVEPLSSSDGEARELRFSLATGSALGAGSVGSQPASDDPEMSRFWR